MVDKADAKDEVRFKWIRFAGGIDNLDASIPLALGFIDSDEWELVCSNRDRGAWIEAGEFSTMALVRALRMIEEWSESDSFAVGKGDYDPQTRENTLRRKVQRKLESMKEDPSLVILLSPGHWKVKSEEYKNYCRMRFEMSKKMDDSWWSFQKESSTWPEVESRRTKLRRTPPTFQMAMNAENQPNLSGRGTLHGHQRGKGWPATQSTIKRRLLESTVERHGTLDKLEMVSKQIWENQKITEVKSRVLEDKIENKIRAFDIRKIEDSRHAAHFSWEKKLSRRYHWLTVGKVKNPEERVWPLKSIPEPDRNEEGKFAIGSKKKKWRIHVSILKIMMGRHEPRGTPEVPEKWITRESISNALKEVGEEKTEGRVSQVLGDLVGLGAIDKKSDKDDGRIKLYRVKDKFRKNREEEIPKQELQYLFELDKMREMLAHQSTENTKQNEMLMKMIDEIKDSF